MGNQDIKRSEEKEREIDSFLRESHGSKRNRADHNWDDAPPSRFRKSNLMGVVIVLGLAVLLIILFWLIKEMKGFKGNPVERIINTQDSGSVKVGELKIDQGKYQAVFLTNGQVYFGKINSHNNTYLELVDIYYLQVKPVLQQGEEGNENANVNPQEQKTELSLVKLGNELHGPLDRMMINKDQVVFVEDLKDDSTVTDAIRRYQQGQNK